MPAKLRSIAAIGFGFGLLLQALGCGVSGGHGEATALQCNDAIDNDGDGLNNCDDPDCWAFAVCADDHGLVTHPVDAGGPSPGTDSAVAEAGTQDAKIDEEDSGGPVPTIDAAVPPVTCGAAKIVCKSTQACIADKCATPPDGSQFLLGVTSAVIPNQTKETFCYDNLTPTGDLCSVSPAAVCGTCKPDPYVIVAINGVTKFQTTVLTENTSPGWNEPKRSVTLLPGDIIRFTVKDSDKGSATDPTVFWCEVTFTKAMAMSASAIQCYPDADMTIPPPFMVKWVVNAEYEPDLTPQ